MRGTMRQDEPGFESVVYKRERLIQQEFIRDTASKQFTSTSYYSSIRQLKLTKNQTSTMEDTCNVEFTRTLLAAHLQLLLSEELDSAWGDRIRVEGLARPITDEALKHVLEAAEDYIFRLLEAAFGMSYLLDSPIVRSVEVDMALKVINHEVDFFEVD